MRPVFKVILLAIAYVACFVLGSTTGLIHPACYAYVGALLPLLFAFIYLGTGKVINCFGVATVLNGVALTVALLTGFLSPFPSSPTPSTGGQTQRVPSPRLSKKCRPAMIS